MSTKPTHTPEPWKLWQDQDDKQPLEIHGQSGDHGEWKPGSFLARADLAERVK